MNKLVVPDKKSLIQERKNCPKPFENKKSIERNILGMQLKKLKDDASFHSSVVMTERNSSMRNVIESSYQMSEMTMSREESEIDFKFISQSKFNISTSLKKSEKKLQPLSGRSTPRKKPQRKQIPSPKTPKAIETKIQQLLKKYYDTNYIKGLLEFMEKDWEGEQTRLLGEKRFEGVNNIITQKISTMNHLTEDFLMLEYDKYLQQEKKLMISIIFKQYQRILVFYQTIFSELLRKIPEDKLLKQQHQLEQLQDKILNIFDVKNLSFTSKMKQRYEQFMEGYTLKKNDLAVGVATKLKKNLNFILEIENYLFLYQKEVMKLRNQTQILQTEKHSLTQMMKKKVNFTPIEIDFQRFRELKEEGKKELFDELDKNYVSFHREQHKKSENKIKQLEQREQKLNKDLTETKKKLKQLEEYLLELKNSIPKKKDASTQLYHIQSAKMTESLSPLSKLHNFLQNVSSPFSFTEKITSSLISLLSVDKILYDYERIKNRQTLKSFSEFMLQWFIVRTGCKKVGQIFTKNFMISLKQLKFRHKRFGIFGKVCGFNGFRKKNIQEDLQYIFFQTNRAWYYIIKLAMAYRKKLNENPSGYHLLPPIPCEAIFKLPLRKIYEVIDEFFDSQQIQKPSDLHHRIDYYAINEISKFKSHDEDFQKQQMQQIHILRQINFDIIAGFVLQYIAKEKCTNIEKFLRTVSLKQKELKNSIGYSEFQTIYRRYYRERRSKIEQIYSQICVMNQHQMLDIENVQPMIKLILEDESGLRGIFDEMQSLKALILPERPMGNKKQPSVNSYQNFRERYYFQFYDFFNATNYLFEIFRITKTIVKKKLKALLSNEEQIQNLLTEKEPISIQQQKSKKNSSEDEQQYSEGQGSINQEKKVKTQKKEEQKAHLQAKLEEWEKISVRIPHFTNKILTLDQIVVHNMRRKEMVQATEFAWRTLREILVVITKE